MDALRSDTLPHRFIVVEGIDGAGTTMLSKRLVEHLVSGGMQAEWTCEPSESAAGKLIRQILRRDEAIGDIGSDSRTMAALFMADRLAHARSVIWPALEAGKIIVCDRYYYSTFVYQGMTRWPAHWLAMLTDVPEPDLTLVLDVNPTVAAERRTRRGTTAELYEDDALQRRFALAYAGLQHHFPADWIVHVDANKPAEDVFRDALAALWRLQSRRRPAPTESGP